MVAQARQERQTAAGQTADNAQTCDAQQGGSEPRWTTQQINEEQKRAVRSILAGHHAPLPYLIFGPPGTGKTMTLTEAAVQVFLSQPTSRLLLAAPSNAAADEVAVRILMKLDQLQKQQQEEGAVPAAGTAHLNRSTIFRCCAYSRPVSDMPRTLKPFSNLGVDGFDMPELETLFSKRVVLVTCLMAAKLHALGLGPGFFTHVFIDEAGHAEEPLTLAAMAGLLPNDESARVVLAGDPQQLGPVILSPLAQKHGLATSAMERLLGVEPYTRHEDAVPPYNVRYITKLVINYRSHVDILRLPNEAFYHGELIPEAPKAQTDSLLGFKALPNKSFPIIFHGVVGKDEREGNSPSWFNQLEAKLVLKYVNELLGMRVGRPNPTDIGIISPYRKQVQKIRELLAPHYADVIKVASVEEFQGQERRVIVISTVRSSSDHLEFDTRHRLGFLSNPKRFNVAITRAKALVIVVGNPAILMHDKHWGAFLQFVCRNGGHVGCGMPPEVIAAAESADAAGLPPHHVWPPYKPPATEPPAVTDGATAWDGPEQDVRQEEQLLEQPYQQQQGGEHQQDEEGQKQPQQQQGEQQQGRNQQQQQDDDDDESYPEAADFRADGHVWEEPGSGWDTGAAISAAAVSTSDTSHPASQVGVLEASSSGGGGGGAVVATRDDDALMSQPAAGDADGATTAIITNTRGSAGAECNTASGTSAGGGGGGGGVQGERFKQPQKVVVQDTEEHVRLADILSRLMYSGNYRSGGGRRRDGRGYGSGWQDQPECGDDGGDWAGCGDAAVIEDEDGDGYQQPVQFYVCGSSSAASDGDGGGSGEAATGDGGRKAGGQPAGAGAAGAGKAGPGGAGQEADEYLPIDEGNCWMVGNLQVEGAEIPRVD